MTAAIGTLTRLGIDTASPVTKRFDYQREDLKLREEFKDGNGLRGTLSPKIERVRPGIRRVSGPIVFQPNAVELALLLPWILGTNGVGSPTATYALADTAQTRFVAIDRNAGNLATYDTVAVDTATFRASQGEPLEVELDLVGKDETIGGSFPAISIDTANGPWMLHDLVLTINAVSAIKPRDFTLTVSNGIDRERFFNTQTLTAANKLSRRITFGTMVPYGDFTTLYGTGAGGVAVTAVFTNGGAVLTFSLVKVAFPRESAATPGRVEVMLPLSGQAYQSGATLELETSLNPGP